jgi:glutathione S-transferase
MAREALLYDLEHSPACAKVRICLQVKGVPYRRIAPSVREVLRDAPLPRLVLGEAMVVGGDAIAHQIDVQWPTPALVPTETDARAYCDLLEGWADAALGGAVRRFVWGPEASRVRAARATASEVTGGPLTSLVAAVLARRAAAVACSPERASEGLRAHVQVLDVMLGDRPFLVGRMPTRADLAAYAQLACARRSSDDVSFDAWPAVSAWLARLDDTPAIGTALRA